MSSDSTTYTFAAPYSASLSFSPDAAPGPPMTTADGSPSWRAAVSSSKVTFLTFPSTASTTTRTSAMPGSVSSDELLRREEVGDLDAAVALVLDGLPGLA